MDMATFKTLEFTAIFGAIGWFWWSQRKDRLRRQQAERDAAESETTRTDDGPGAG